MKNRNWMSSCFLMAVLLMMTGLSGCQWEGLIGEGNYPLGQECEGANQWNHCYLDEICKENVCEKAGEKCPGSEGLGNDNGFGYCNIGFTCLNNKCVKANVACTPETVAEACGIGAECINSACKCGEIDCGGSENTCCKDDSGKGIGCFDLKSNRDNCGECGRSCDTGFLCIEGECKESCLSSQILCGGKCIDPQTDLAYCGAKDDCKGGNAGQSCDSGMVCAGGVCSKSCLAGQVLCGGKCIDPKSDSAFCGAKLGGSCDSDDEDDANYGGMQCPSGMACIDGTCIASCLEGQVYCGSKCVDPLTDTTYCGAVVGGTCSSSDSGDSNYQGKACVAGEVCKNGKCEISCQDGLIDCNGVCINPETDKDNCGACGNKCSENAQICSEGKCVCPTGYTLCSETGEGCVDLAATHRSSCKACIDNTWGDCDSNWKTGCETNLMTDNDNCASCKNGCTSGTFCSNGSCATTCGGGLTKCTVGNADACYNLTNDASHCSACNKACPTKPHATATCSESSCIYTCDAGYTNCGTPSEPNCLNLNAEDDNCGACGNRCGDLPNVSGGTCKGGVCQISCQSGFADCNASAKDGCEAKLSETNRAACEQCLQGYADCDNNWNNGCEINTQADNANCGTCSKKCDSGKVCSSGSCSSSCLSGQTLCSSSCLTLGDMHLKDCNTCADNYCDSDKNKINGCEVQKGTSVDHCTACGVKCATKPNATALCNSGTCTYICAAGYTNCGTNTEPNCIKLDGSDVNNCGYCGYKCTEGLSNVATATCDKGVCKVQTCAAGYANCDGSDANGCEIDGMNNIQYCGATNTTCANKTCDSGYVCSEGKCGLSCQSGLANCSGLCVKLSENVSNCGTCGSACSAKDQATATCSNGACNYTCNLGYTNCGSITEPNCKNTASDVNNCGACGVSCGSGQSCVQGVCTCQTSSQTNCSGVCKALATDAENCGSCGNKCSAIAPLNAEPDPKKPCQNGVCYFVCKKNFTNCGSDFTATTINCVNTQSDGQNCNTCGKKCPSGTACSAGNCATSCPEGQEVCGSSCVTLALVNLNGGCNKCAAGYCDTDTDKIGCETAIGSNVNHCTACNVACPTKDNATATCSNKTCVYTCNAGYLNCGTASAPNCVSTATSSAHCGSCQNTCDNTLTNAQTATCSGGVCGITCKSGFADCNSKAEDGCETSIHGNADNCGGCGIKCSNFVPANAQFDKCSNTGECTYKCVGGYTNCGGGTTASTIHCVDTNTDSTCCGASKTNCISQSKVCDNGSCVSSNCSSTECLSSGACLKNDAQKCGSSCINCKTANNASNGTCSNGVCTITACKDGYCLKDGQCVNTQTACGSNCVDCNTANNASAGTCSANGTCTITACKENYCLQNGSCIANTSDTACGASCNNCLAVGKSCKNGVCVKTDCDSGYCLVSNQCSSNLSDNEHCGDACKNCTQAGAAGTGSASGYCSGGTCQTTSCSSGYCLVNGQCSANTSNTSCGANCTNCSASNKICVNGECKCAANTCAVGSTCVDNTSNNYCGANCTDCTASGKICSGGSCVQAACNSGECSVGNDCVANNNNYGCGNSCVDCTTAYSDKHVTDAYCKGSVKQCVVAECGDGYADCDKSVANGCEVDLNTTAAHCGTCGHACGSNETCVDGVCKCGSGAACALPPHATSVACNESTSSCVVTCTENYHVSEDSDYCEKDTSYNCGASHLNCSSSGMTCSSGSCVCGGSACSGEHKACCGDVCVDLSSTSSCGTTCENKTACVLPDHGKDLACSNGTCTFGCESGWHVSGSTCVAD